MSDWGHHRIRCVSPDGTITTLAGNGKKGSSGDGKLAIDARLAEPGSLAVGLHGEVYVATPAAKRVRIITADGKIATFLR